MDAIFWYFCRPIRTELTNDFGIRGGLGVVPSLTKDTTMFHKIDYPFLIGAFISFLASVSLWFLVSKEYGLFVGLWVPSILSLWVGVRVVILGTGITVRRGK